MSRLIFLNLPPNINTSSFRSHLTSPAKIQDAQITDIKVNSKRRFAFVGYKTEEDGKRVKEWFDGTFGFGGGKVKVDFVRDDPLGPKPSKRPKVEVSEQKTAQPTPEAGPSKQKKEFMEAMRGGDNSVIPSDETLYGKSAAKKSEKSSAKSGNKEDKDRLPSSWEEDVPEDDDDAAWLRRRQTGALEEEAEGQGNIAGPSTDPDTALILSTGRLFVRNLPFSATSEDLSTHFSTFGHVESVHLPVSPSGQPLGTAFILFRDPQHALEAYQSLDKTTFQGRLLHVLPGRARPGQEPVSNGQTSGMGGEGQVLGKIREGRQEVKNKADQKRKEASSKGVNWATLYMNSDAVAGSVAHRMGISKSELLSADSSDPSASSASAAVKLALAETHVIAETKAYFTDAGLNIDALQPRVPRSQTIILVKNIPYGTTLAALTDLFSPHGEIERILLPPAGTLGVVEYKQPADAGRAFKALSYTRIGSAVLYLEKGPQGMFTSTAAAQQRKKEEEADEAKRLAEKMASAGDETSRQAPGEDDESGSTLYLKGLSFSTTTPRLQSLLSTLPGYSFARVQTKPDPKREGERLSMGYGFVGFKTRKEAQKAMTGLEGFEIDGKVLEVKFAQRGADDKGDESKAGKELQGKTKGTKIMVKNLPFEASKKEVRDLFSAYGSLKALRLPKKSLPTASGSRSSRGFAFLEFTTHAEASRAMEALKHTHLLGRHLVLQWAEQNEGVDVAKLRAKASADWKNAGESEGGRLGKRKLDLTGGGKGDADEEGDGLEE